MSEAELRELAVKAGIAPEWKDLAGVTHAVPPRTIRALLSMLGFPCGSASELRDSRARLEGRMVETATPSLVTARVGEPLVLPALTAGAKERQALLRGRRATRAHARTKPLKGASFCPGSTGPDIIAWKWVTRK